MDSGNNLPNRNTEWAEKYPGVLWCYVLMVFMAKWFLGFWFTPDVAWTTLACVHGVSTFILFHWIKGSPDENTQGEYNSLTFWEQLDAGVPWTYNKKFLTLVPTLLCLIASYCSNYNLSYIAVNLTVWSLLIVPKVPGMHRVRLFGWNSSADLEDEVAVLGWGSKANAQKTN